MISYAIENTDRSNFGEGQALKKRFKRRNAIEPVIAHEKQDHTTQSGQIALRLPATSF